MRLRIWITTSCCRAILFSPQKLARNTTRSWQQWAYRVELSATSESEHKHTGTRYSPAGKPDQLGVTGRRSGSPFLPDLFPVLHPVFRPGRKDLTGHR